jgi:hypothetical protein
VIIPASLTIGTIEVDVLSCLDDKGPADARAFAGLAYRIADDGDGFEAVYLRPLNGLKTNPPSPPDQHAVRYFAYPDWAIRQATNGVPGRPIRSARRHRPGRVDQPQDRLTETGVDVMANGTQVLKVTETKAAPMTGAVGLFVDIGSESYFSKLTIRPR